MRIGIDLRSVSSGRMTGVETVLWAILPHLFSQTCHTFVLFVNGAREIPIIPRLRAFERRFSNVTLVSTTIPNKVLNCSMAFVRIPHLDALMGGIDVVWSPNILFSSFSRGVPVVQSFHDLSFERYPEFFSLRRRCWHVAVSPRRLARAATRIVVPSQSTRDDVEAFYGVSSDRIVVIPHGAPFVRASTPSANVETWRRLGIPPHYLLFVGSFEPRKNIVSLLHAYAGLREAGEDIPPLVLAGSSGWLEREVFEVIDALNLRSVVFLVRSFRDEEKNALYEGASVFIYPSLFEGFGLPVLEAMTYGVPVVTGNTSALPEVAGDAALLVDVCRANDIALAVRELLRSKELRELYIERGKRRAARLTWERAAQSLMEVFEDVTKTRVNVRGLNTKN